MKLRKTAKLEPCPFPSCGSSNSEIVGDGYGNYWVHCECDAQGPLTRTVQAAADEWNAAPRKIIIQAFTKAQSRG